MQERVNRLFEDALGGSETEETQGTGRWSPAVDIYETGSEFVVEAELPEVSQSDIDIRIQDTTLTIQGERRSRQPAMEGYHRIERAHGRFSRSFLLPGSVDRESVSAALRDGILRVVLPKKVEVLPKQIKIVEQE